MPLQSDPWALLIFLIIGGTLGGLAASLSTRMLAKDLADPKDMPPQPDPSWYAYLIGGAVAALTVPLFLRLTSSELLDHVLSPGVAGARTSDVWVLLGFCVVVGFSSKAFMQGLSQRLVAMATEARQQAATARKESHAAQATADHALEAIDNGDTTSTRHALASVKTVSPPTLSPDEQKIWSAISDSTYTNRSLAGLAKDAGLPAPKAQALVDKMVEQGLLDSRVSRKTGNMLYSLKHPD